MHLSNAFKFIPIIITFPLLNTGVLCLAQSWKSFFSWLSSHPWDSRWLVEYYNKIVTFFMMWYIYADCHSFQYKVHQRKSSPAKQLLLYSIWAVDNIYCSIVPEWCSINCTWMSYHSLMKEHPPSTVGSISCIESKFTERKKKDSFLHWSHMVKPVGVSMVRVKLPFLPNGASKISCAAAVYSIEASTWFQSWWLCSTVVHVMCLLSAHQLMESSKGIFLFVIWNDVTTGIASERLLSIWVCNQVLSTLAP